MKIRTRHGHFSDVFEEEASRIKKLYFNSLNIDISWTEATAIAAERSLENFWTEDKLINAIRKLRGLK